MHCMCPIKMYMIRDQNQGTMNVVPIDEILHNLDFQTYMHSFNILELPKLIFD